MNSHGATPSGGLGPLVRRVLLLLFMRTLFMTLVLASSIASANGTIVNDEASAAKLVPSSKVRIHEIDDELYGLEVRPGSGKVFLSTAQTRSPYFLIAAVPMMGLGFLPGLVKTSVSGDNAYGQALSGAGIALAGAVVILALVCTFKMFAHWMDEAADAPQRNGRIRELRAERQLLQHD